MKGVGRPRHQPFKVRELHTSPPLFQIKRQFEPGLMGQITIGLMGQITQEKRRGGRMLANLKSMSIEDLWSLHEQLDSVLASKLSAEKAELEKKLGQLKTPLTTARRPYPPVLPKFRNPKRPSETWAGRGKRPRWLTAELRNGKQLNHFRIRPSREEAANSDRHA